MCHGAFKQQYKCPITDPITEMGCANTLVARITVWSWINVWVGYFVHLLHVKMNIFVKFQILLGEKTRCWQDTFLLINVDMLILEQLEYHSFVGNQMFSTLVFRSFHFLFLVTFGVEVTKILSNLCLHFAQRNGYGKTYLHI